MLKIKLTLLFFFVYSISFAQLNAPKVYTQDIDNFWIAYDSVKTTTDTTKQEMFIQKLYVDKGTEGLKAFMVARDYSPKLWVKLVSYYPKFWASIRQNTLTVKQRADQMEKTILKFKEIYPELKEAKIFFTVGGLRSGGTIDSNLALIGSEIATGDVNTDVSEFKDNWLRSVFKDHSLDNIVSLSIHEYVHTQQNSEGNYLLSKALQEGSCDFITELVIEKPLQTSYIKYGNEHANELKEKFKTEMFMNSYRNWLYNGSNAKTMADLGYYMGYVISKSYYNNSKNKKKAIKEIIELNFSDSTAVESFLKKSRFYTEKIDRDALINSFRKNQPTSSIQILNGELVDPSIKELTINFSKPMNKNRISIFIGDKGKSSYPFTKIVGFSDEGTSLTLKTDLKPNQEYEFIIPDGGFESIDGYPVIKKKYTFKTKP